MRLIDADELKDAIQKELNPSKKGTEEHIAERISRKEGFDRT